MKKFNLKPFAVIIIFLTGLAIISGSMGKRVLLSMDKNPHKDDIADSEARGLALYESNCTRCHGSSGTGDGPEAETIGKRPPNLISYINRRKVNSLVYTTIYGKGKFMPAFQSTLSNDQIWDIGNYIVSLKPKAQ